MSVGNKEPIDIVSIDKEDNVALTITDHLEWDIENEHLLVLQDKINSYLGAIEGGELYTKYPNAENRSIIIRVVHYIIPMKKAKYFWKGQKEY